MSKIRIKRWWYNNGQLYYDAPEQNGQLHGTKKWWYENGQLGLEMPYQNVQRHGIEIWWNNKGKCVREQYWLYGKSVAEEEYRHHILMEQLACLK